MIATQNEINMAKAQKFIVYSSFFVMIISFLKISNFPQNHEKYHSDNYGHFSTKNDYGREKRFNKIIYALRLLLSNSESAGLYH